MSAIYIQNMRKEGTIERAKVHQYTGRDMPPQMAAVHAYLKKKQEPIGGAAKGREEAVRPPPPSQSEPPKTVEDEDAVPPLREGPRKIQYSPFGLPRPEEWHDAGSQTDESEDSGGEWSDDTMEQRRQRAEEAHRKAERRIRRTKELKRKHGIV